MTTLYLSTDIIEAETIIEDPNSINSIHEYHDISIEDGAIEAERIGFNPMSKAIINSAHANEIKKAIAEFHRQGIFVTLVEDDGRVEKILPKDLEFRRVLVNAALQKNFSPNSRLKNINGDLSRTGRLLQLSNNPGLE